MRHRWRDGYHFGVLCCALGASIVFTINVILTVVIGAKYTISGGIATFQDGDCDKTRRLDLWLHLLINALSTLLLGASNYSMQCLSAPTRQDIDNAHRQNIWMDIGVPSVKNIFRISRPRKVLWCLLFMSSVPIHLIYNSVIFSSTSYSEWTFFAVTSDFLTGAPFNKTALTYYEGWESSFDPRLDRLERLQNSTSLVRLENDACLDAYGTAFVSKWGDVLLISTNPSINDSLLNQAYAQTGPGTGDSPFCYTLIPADRTKCSIDGRPDPNNWVVWGEWDDSQTSDGSISHCMAERAQEHCKIRFSMPFMCAVIACNLVKMTCMWIIVWKLDPYPLVTIGDAIASFLDSPGMDIPYFVSYIHSYDSRRVALTHSIIDPNTAGSCLSSKSRLKEGSIWTRLPSRYRRRQNKWFASASISRWLITTILCALTIGAAIGLLIYGIANPQISNPFSLGFGAATATATIYLQNSDKNMLASILLANTPQLLLSFLYFGYNALWTCMLLAQEWSGYANERKPLRVTSPKGEQRSTHRLQLPYRYGIPLLIISGTLHWLVSRSIFLVVLEGYNFDGIRSASSDDQATCGYSPIAILTAIITGSIVLLAGIAMGFRRTPLNGIPLATSCSAVISAACHPPPEDREASKKALMWGACGSEADGSWDQVMDVTKTAFDEGKESLRQQEGAGERTKVGHCSFTSLDVEEPIEGELYAGLRKRKT